MSPRLGMLWHLHQPDYRDPDSGRPTMPWARLHALRGYRDLLIEAVTHELAMTVNVVPSLWDQLLYYAAGGGDRHLDLTRAPAASLSAVEAAEAVSTLPGGHPAMTQAWGSYAQLRRRLADGSSPSVQDLRDLQVWATLSWFGSTAHADFPQLGALCTQGRGFTEADKAAMLAVHDGILADLPDRLVALARATAPALSTSPYFHPILPLLVDVSHARRCMPELPDEVRFAWPEDALRQLVDARARVRELTGTAPVGLWPSEGSVSPEVVQLAGEAGFRWLLSDVGVLARSERTAEGPGPHDLGHGMVGFFRDTELSDRIGFRYATADPDEAVADLLQGVAARDEPLVVVALDGENPWETFADAGRAFRHRLYDALRTGPVRPITFDEAAAQPPVGRITHLHTGSWIGADFRIWIGHPADRQAYHAMAATREALAEAPAEVQEAAMPHMLAAEGSDWNWWYGDDFHTEHEGAFDALFRAHLRAVWRALGRRPPQALAHPIGGAGAPVRVEPSGFLPVDWRNAGAWLPWVRAGRLRAWGGSMATGSAVLELRYGWERGAEGVGALWVRVDTRGGGWAVAQPRTGVELRPVPGGVVARIEGPGPVRLRLASPTGTQWPAEPVTLEAPIDAALRWWDV
ncbi:MAG: glycoside hydrolase [Myxococcales bacterium]|nr:glycoside hydrolase [Myxococcales bacterium]